MLFKAFERLTMYFMLNDNLILKIFLKSQKCPDEIKFPIAYITKRTFSCLYKDHRSLIAKFERNNIRVKIVINGYFDTNKKKKNEVLRFLT